MRDIDVRTKRELDKRNTLIQQNQETYNLWRTNHETRVFCAVREFTDSVGRITVVPLPKGKAGVVHSKTVPERSKQG